MGAGGAILAQIVSASFSAARDSRRLEWEKETKEEEAKHRQAQRFLDQKRGLYARFLDLTYTIMQEVSSKLKEEGRTKKPAPLKMKVAESLDELNSLRWEIQLISPGEIGAQIELVYTYVPLSGLIYYRPDEFPLEHRESTARKGLREWRDLRLMMRADLSPNLGELEKVIGQIERKKLNPGDQSEPEEHRRIIARIDELFGPGHQ